MNRRRLMALIGMTGVAALALPMTVTATTAAWNDTEWVHGAALGTSTLECGTTSGFASTSYGRFLSGTLLGTDLDPIADLEQMTLAVDDTGTLDVDPAGAIDLGSPPPTHTYANPFDLSLLNILGVTLSGFSLPVPGAALGAANQYAQVNGLGSATGASGLVNDSGAVTVGSTPPASLPAPATIDLASLLPAVAGITDADLEIGAVGASAQLDGCAALYSAIWGDGSVTGITRDYGIAGLGLEIDSPLVAGLVDSVDATVAALGTAVSGLVGPGGVIADDLVADLELALPGLLTTAVSGNVSLTGLDLPGAVSTLLTTALTDGVVTIDLDDGVVDVDLDALLPSLNGAAPNTEVVLNPTVLNPIVTRVNTLLQNWIQQVVTALDTEIGEATLTVALDVLVEALGTDVLRVNLDVTSSVEDVLDGTSDLAVTVDVLGLVSALDILLGSLGLPTVTELVADVLALGPALAATLVDTLETALTDVVDLLDTTLTAAVPGILTALGGVVGALPTILSVMVNVQPDRPGAPAGGIPFIPGTDGATPQYVVSALRIGLADFLTPGAVAAVTLGTASAGPVTAP